MVCRVILLCLSLISGFAFAGETANAETPVLPFFDTADFTPRWAGESTDNVTAGSHRIAGFAFSDQNGKAVGRQNLSGKIHVADFFFTTCPGICAKQTTQMGKVQAAFAEDDSVILVSYSVWPEVDTQAVLRRYADTWKVRDNKWFLLRGDKERLYALARESYFADGMDNQGAGSEKFLHTENLFLVDPQGRIRGVYNGTRAMDVKRLIEDITLLKAEINASETAAAGAGVTAAGENR